MFVSRFSPNRTDPAVLEAIFVQRHRLAETWFDRLRDSVLTGVKHHLLAVGPRGCGKSHLVALLIRRLRNDQAVRERARIAWLPEDEVTPSFWKFLLRILRSLNAEYGDEFPPPPRDNLEDASDDRRTAVLTSYLLEKLGGRTLVVVVENLDDVMRGLQDEGQKRWRAFLQQYRVAATLATAQQLTEDMSHRERAFFGFFQIENLQPLTADEALELLRKIAEHTGNIALAAFLQSATGRARVRAIRHIAGGGHRVFIILSEFATRQNLDDLVTAFEELLDELTPYYQERLRWLPDQQREIVEFLCRQARTVPVKEIAAGLYLSEQLAAAQLKSLRDKGYVTASTVGRESRYDLAEPLMRLCVEVKDPQREPIRLIVEFLRIWYDQAEAESRFRCAAEGLERQYFGAVLKAHEPGIPGPVEEALKRDLEAARATGDQEELVRVLVELAATADSAQRCLRIAGELNSLGRHAEALEACDRGVELGPIYALTWNQKGCALYNLDRYKEALAAFDRAIELDPKNATTRQNRGWSLGELGSYAEALAAFDQAIELDPKDAHAWNGKGHALKGLGRFEEALAIYDQAIELDPKYAFTWNNKGYALNKLGRYQEALAACDRAIELDPKHASAWKHRGRAKLGLGKVTEAMADFTHAIELDKDYPGAFESLAEAHVLKDNWAEAERMLVERFRLASSPRYRVANQHLPEVIASIFRASGNRDMWMHRVGRLADIAKEAREQWQQNAAGDMKNPTTPPNPLALLANALVRSLTNKAYAEASAESLRDWAGVWRDVAERHPDLSLAARLFEVGARYLQTHDERVLLDLLQEERTILTELFGLNTLQGNG